MTTPQDPGASSDPFGPGAGGASQPGYGTPQPGSGTPPAGYGAPQPGYEQPQQGYGAPGGFGAPPAGYGAPAGYGGSPFGQPGGPQLAGWGARAQSALVDWFGPSLVAGIFYRGSTALGTLLYLAALAWAVYNAYLQGNTGQSYGKKIAGTRLLREADGQVLGGGLGIGRYFLHILDGLPCYLGFLWPLWDGKKQTFADKIVKSVVVKA